MNADAVAFDKAHTSGKLPVLGGLPWLKITKLVTRMPRIESGFIYPSDEPGPGVDLLPDLPKRKDASIRAATA